MSKNWTSIFETELYHDGECTSSGPRRNLRTTSADWRSGLDWQSKAMGGGVAIGSAATGTTASAPTSTTYTLTGVSAPGSTTAYSGYVINVDVTFGVIVSNTNASPPVVTVDKWYDPTSLGGSAASTPANPSNWVILPGQLPAAFLALTEDATTPDVSDVTLASEITTSGLGRALGTYSHTSGATSYQLQKVFSALGTKTINKEAVFAASTSTAGGAMPFESAEPNPPTLVNGDQLTQTCTINI